MFFVVCIIGLIVAANARNNYYIRRGICRDVNAYYRVEGKCDSYVECNEHLATIKTCPVGLHFIADVVWPQYPCAYSSDAQCDSDYTLQEVMPECKNHYGFFASPLASSTNCGSYRMCVDGKPYEMECSTGLAFNPETGLCDWPELVSSCDAEAFLGFKCPPATYDNHGNADVKYFGIKGRCHYYFSCMGGVARLQNCDFGYTFDHNINRCVDSTRVYCTEKKNIG